MTRLRTVLSYFVLAVPALAGILPAFGFRQGSEEELKAAFLYKFTHFVEWPEGSFPDAGAPYVVGVLGKDVFGKVLDATFEGKTVNGRGFSILRADAPEDLRNCHLVYVCPSERDRKTEVLRALKDGKTLVVGDAEGFAEAGASINFVLEDRRVRLEINPAAAGRAGLKLSSKLLQVSRIVKDRAATR